MLSSYHAEGEGREGREKEGVSKFTVQQWLKDIESHT